jgi:putative oxygen-independent coproporphyrinogen III oxidase
MLPLSLYIHVPWCIQKCPYCDFNSHKSPEHRPEQEYIQALLNDLDTDLARFPVGPVSSIFIGGGTPSLLSAEAYAELFNGLKTRLTFTEGIEITLEANPGTVEQGRFSAYRAIGINRLSLGIQSFNPKHLKALGRIHDDKQAHFAIESARNAGFTNLNLDIMHSLPNQTVEEGLDDLTKALSHTPEHISWYQLTIEPNTVFYKQRPTLPSEEVSCTLEEQGLLLLASHGFERYEISAYSKNNKPSQHNLNYWLFGDYLGIGAGAHGKLTTEGDIFRTQKVRQPQSYLNPNKPFLAESTKLTTKDLLFEFMLNATRLEAPIPYALFKERTYLEPALLHNKLQEAEQKGLITSTATHWQITPLGRRYTNDLQELFLF